MRCQCAPAATLARDIAAHKLLLRPHAVASIPSASARNKAHPVTKERRVKGDMNSRFGTVQTGINPHNEDLVHCATSPSMFFLLFSLGHTLTTTSRNPAFNVWESVLSDGHHYHWPPNGCHHRQTCTSRFIYFGPPEHDMHYSQQQLDQNTSER